MPTNLFVVMAALWLIAVATTAARAAFPSADIVIARSPRVPSDGGPEDRLRNDAIETA